MELELITKDKNTLEFYLLGERHTLPNLLKNRIENESGLEFDSYTLDHPMADKARFIVKTSGSKSPVKAIEGACEKIEKDLKQFSEKMKKLK